MFNKKNIWFLTLFSLVLVLSVYYITMPDDVLVTSNVPSEIMVDIDSPSLVAARVSKEEHVLQELESLNNILTDVSKSAEEKSVAYEKMKNLNMNKALEEKLENKIKNNFNLESVVKVEEDNINIAVAKENGDTSFANDIMRLVQSEYDTKKYISVKFE